MMKYIPRWLYSGKQNIAASTLVELDSARFANNTDWPFRLQWLSLVGFGAAVPDANNWGGIGRLLEFQLGISGKGAQYPIAVIGGSLFAETVQPRLGWSYSTDTGAAFTFDKRVILPKSSGILAEFGNDDLVRTYSNPAMIIKAVSEAENGPALEPAVIGDRERTDVLDGTSVMLRGAGMRNDGENDLILRRMSLASGCDWYPVEVDIPNALRFSSVSWRLNPTTGPMWMPDPSLIPVGNIAPYNRGFDDVFGVGPAVYEFPPTMVINPGQRMELDVRNTSGSVAASLGLCLFGYLEVE